MHATAQTYETKFARPLSDVIKDIEKRFDVRLKCGDVDTTGLVLDYADFRIRPYSLDETLQNVLMPFDFKVVYQNGMTRTSSGMNTSAAIHASAPPA